MPPEDPTPKDTALKLAANRAIAKADSKMPDDEREARVDQFVRMGALFLKGDLSVGVMPDAESQDFVRRSVPALLGPVDPTPKQKRDADFRAAVARNGARLDASRQPPPPSLHLRVAALMKPLIEKDPLLQGESHRARMARAKKRDEFYTQLKPGIGGDQ